jgi:hypothetical protein
MDIRKFFAAKAGPAKAGPAKAGPTKAALPAKKKLKVGSTSVRSAPRKTATVAPVSSQTSSTRRHQEAKVSVAKSPVRQPVTSADLQDEEGLSDYEKVINTSSAAPLLSLRNLGHPTQHRLILGMPAVLVDLATANNRLYGLTPTHARTPTL